MSLHNASRRDFLKRSAALSVLGGAAPFALNLAGMGAAAAADSDYKALVCLFFFGGNDQTNTVIPYDTASYNDYFAARDSIARLQTDLLPLTTLSNLGGRQLALPKEFAPLKTLFDGGKAAVLANVGPLIEPIANAAEYKSGKKRIPPKLFSHNDQVATWQAFTPEGAKLGWGGRFGDLLGSMNSNAVFTAISASGNTVFLSGQNTFQYQISSGGAVGINNINSTSLFGSPQGAAALRAVSTGSNSAQLFEREHGRVVQRSIDAQAAVGAALTTLPTTDARVALPAAQAQNRLAQQLQVVARLAGVSASLGVKRQVFFVSIGGFDTHDNQLTAQPALHASIAGAVDYFYNATVQLGIANNVTLFTGSDFGRTLTSNGDGSDHGWGSHHFIVGGAVKGQDVYGNFPVVKLGTAEDLGSGRLLPTTSVDQYAATLGRWFGVSDSDLGTILPNIGNFSTRYLNFV